MSFDEEELASLGSQHNAKVQKTLNDMLQIKDAEIMRLEEHCLHVTTVADKQKKKPEKMKADVAKLIDAEGVRTSG